MKCACNGYGYVWGSSINLTVSTFSTWNLQLNYNIKEALRLYSVSGSNNVYVRINSTTPSNTLGIVNVSSTVNALNIKNAAGSSTVLSVSNAGNTSIAGTLGVTGNTSLNGSRSVCSYEHEIQCGYVWKHNSGWKIECDWKNNLDRNIDCQFHEW